MSRRVLLFSDATAPGGVDACVRDQALAGRQAGWDVRAALDVSPGADRLAADLQALGFEVARATLHKQHGEPAQAAAIDALLAAIQPDVAHVHLPAPWAGVLARERVQAARLPLVATEHLVSPSFTLTPELRARLQAVYQYARTHIAVSEETKRVLVAQFGLPGNKITVIPNSLDFDEWRPPTTAERAAARARLGLQAEKALLTAVRLDRQKGLDVLLTALGRLSDLPWTLLLAGTGPEEVSLREQAGALGLRDHVCWLGWRDDVPQLLAAADLFVLPSRYEGLSIALLEAMASGVPVVATAVSGTPEALVGGQYGYLIPPDDPSALADTLRTALLADNTALAMEARLHVVRRHNAHVNLPRAIALWAD